MSPLLIRSLFHSSSLSAYVVVVTVPHELRSFSILGMTRCLPTSVRFSSCPRVTASLSMYSVPRTNSETDTTRACVSIPVAK